MLDQRLDLAIIPIELLLPAPALEPVVFLLEELLFIAPLVLVFFMVELAFLEEERMPLERPAVVDLLLADLPAVDLLPAVLLPAILLPELRAPAVLAVVLLLFELPRRAPPSSLSEALPPLPFAGDTERSAAGTPRLVVLPRGLVVAAATPLRFAVMLFVRASSF